MCISIARMSMRWLLCALVAVLGLATGALAREPQPAQATQGQAAQGQTTQGQSAQGQSAQDQTTQAQSGSNRAGSRAVREIPVADLPAEARTTLAAIRRGGPFDYSKDGTMFFNREGLLPRRPRGYYTEYTVRTPGARDRGARRIVAGGDPMRSGEYYYTPDHYRSFLRIRE